MPGGALSFVFALGLAPEPVREQSLLRSHGFRSAEPE